MIESCFRSQLILTISLLIALLPQSSEGDAFTPGNILVSSRDSSANSNQLIEYTTSGTEIQSIAIPDPGNAEDPRDLIYDPQTGRVHLINGSLSPFLSTYDPFAGSWQHSTATNWQIGGPGYYGGIALNKNDLFVVDTLFPDTGYVRFDKNTGVGSHVQTGGGAFDVTLGLNGFLYGMAGSRGQAIIQHNPETLEQLNTTVLDADDQFTGLAVDENGFFYTVNVANIVMKFDTAGNLVAQRQLPLINGQNLGLSYNDVDINAEGMLVIGGRFGQIVLTDHDFGFLTPISVPEGSGFVAFVNVPEPNMILFPILITVVALVRRQR